jgi:serine protease
MALSCKSPLTAGALAALFAALSVSAFGCAPDDAGAGEGEPGEGDLGEFQSFEEFRASVYLEPWEGGAYIVEGDIAVYGDDELRAYYEGLRFGQNALVLGTRDGGDIVWGNESRLGLSYCIDGTFSGEEKDKVISALRVASARWQAVADVQFTYKADEDDNCTGGNNNVTFNVTKVQTNEKYFARAFFPNDSRDRRQLNVDQLAFEPIRASTVDEVMTHELGHVLGFRHEHGRLEALRKDPELCAEATEGWHAFTPYDDRSVMAYPECGGYAPGQFAVSLADEQGAAAVYGAPGRWQPQGAVPVAYRYELIGISRGSLQPLNNAFTARRGTYFVAVMKGASVVDQPNLFVNIGSDPVAGSATCEPQIDSESPETCRIRVPDDRDVDIRVAYQAGGVGSTPSNFGLSIVYVPVR